MKWEFLISSFHSATFPFPRGLGRVVSRFFAVNLKVFSQGNLRGKSLQGPRSVKTGWLTNTIMGVCLYLFAAVHFSITAVRI